MMNECKSWQDKISSNYLHEKILFSSSLFIIIILSLDWAFSFLPIGNYGLILTILFLSIISTWTSFSFLKWMLQQRRPALVGIGPSSKVQNENKFLQWFINQYINKENKILDQMFSVQFESFNYPTSVKEQINLLMKDIEREFIKSWYSSVSLNPIFLSDTHLFLEEVSCKIIDKIRKINVNYFILNVSTIYLQHLQEYRRCLRKTKKLKNCNIDEFYRFKHVASKNNIIFQHYLIKLSRHVLHEFVPHDFHSALSFKIIYNIVARKILYNFVLHLEDPVWIDLQLLYLMNYKKYEEVAGGNWYQVGEKVVEAEAEDQQRYKTKPLLLNRKMNQDLFKSTVVMNNAMKRLEPIKERSIERGSLTLNLSDEEQTGNISSVLGGLISSAAGPLLPDNFSVNYQPINKMWESPVFEVPKTNPFKKRIVEGLKLEDVKVSEIKERRGLTKSRSSDNMSQLEESLTSRDVSVGEELCEAIFPGNNIAPNTVRKLTKTKSFDSSNLTDEDLDEELFPKKDGVDEERDVSPVYEEPEDFATTIAKLRSLLQQRESSSTLSDKSTHSIDSQSNISKDLSLDPEPAAVCDKIHSDILENTSIEANIPNDGHLFLNIHIPRTEVQADSSGSSFVLYTIKYEGVYLVKTDEEESHLILQPTVVKRRFQEFLNLQTTLENNANLKNVLKGIKGPSKWLNLTFSSKTDDSTTSTRRPVLETYLKQLCMKKELCQSQELQEFLAYGNDASSTFVKKDSPFSVHRIDKFLANKVSGVFNSIKTALPTFDFDQSSSISNSTDSLKSFNDQKLLQGFLNFGSKIEVKELVLEFRYKEATGDSLIDDVRHFFTERSDCIEDALEALDSHDWLAETGECHPISSSSGTCVWTSYKHLAVDDEIDELDSLIPHICIMLNILCELSQESGSWLCKEPTILVFKYLIGHLEPKVKEELSKLDWDKIVGNCIRLFRAAVFSVDENKEKLELEIDLVKQELSNVLIEVLPEPIKYILTIEVISSMMNLFVESFQNFRSNRDVILRFLDLLFVRLLSCSHTVETQM